jgi:hypothetical protein
MQAKTCEACGSSFVPKYRVTKAYWARRRFCSDACKATAIRPPTRTGTGKPIAVRFWEKVEKHASTACWLWTGMRNKDGYGILSGGAERADVNFLRAHRISWELHYGPIHSEQHVLHKCDNPPCVNPRHLFLGDQVANNADRDSKGRGGDRCGERNGRASLTDKEVEKIRRKYADGGITQADLGAEYGVSEVQVWRIVHRYQRK